MAAGPLGCRVTLLLALAGVSCGPMRRDQGSLIERLIGLTFPTDLVSGKLRASFHHSVAVGGGGSGGIAM